MILLLLLFHLPFLGADPDSLVSLNTRGAWTDEGLFTAQLRDYINHGTLNLYNSNGFILTPVLNAILFPFYELFGTNIITGRVVALLFSLGVLILYSTNAYLILPAIFYLIFAGLQFHYFQFSHYGMGEIFAVNMVLLTLYALVRFDDSTNYKKRLRWLLLSVFFIFLAYGIKIQFAYLAVLVPSALLLKASSLPTNQKNSRKEYYKDFKITLAFTVVLALVYLIAWYWPHREFYNSIMNYETSERFKNTLKDLLDVYRFNFINIIWVKELWPLMSVTLLAFVGLIIVLIFRRKSLKLPLALVFGLIWLIIEQHKIAMIYLPTRYFISLIASAGIVVSLSLSYLIKRNDKTVQIIIPLMLIVAVWNIIFLFESFQRRTYNIRTVENYIEKSNLDKSKPVLGIWAYTLAADSKAPTIGVRNNYLNFKNPIHAFHPQLVITEFNQAESDSAWARQGIDLASISDSVRRIKVWRYDLDFYWIRQTE